MDKQSLRLWLKNMKLKKVILILFLSVFVLAQSSGVVFAATVSVTGKAKVLNTDNSYLDFTNYNSNTTVDNVTGNFSGYAFLEDVGWLAFGTTDNSLGPVDLDLSTGRVSGKAKSLNTGAYLDFTNYNSNVTLALGNNTFSGYAFSEDIGWLNFSDTGATLATSISDSFELDSPGGDTYTNSERPTFKWKGATDSTSLSKYSFEADNGDMGDFSVDNIAVSGTTDNSQDRYLIHYDNFSDSDNTNNYVSVYTKSSSVWDSSMNDGKLKEGKRSWTVKAHDSAGSVRSKSRTLFVDRTGPSVAITQVNSSPFADNLATLDTTPTIFGKIIDSLAGDKTDNYVASGPKSIEVKIEKKNFSGFYDLHSLATISLTESYWADTGVKITDNNKNTANKYSTFSFTPSENLPLGTYKITLTGKDNAGNSSGDTPFSLKITTLAKIAPPEEKEIIEKVEEDPETVVEVPAYEASVVQDIITRVAIALKDFYWKVVDSAKILASAGVKLAGNIAALWQAYGDFAQDTNQKVLAFIDRQMESAGQTIVNLYDSLAQKAPGGVREAMLALKNALQASVDTIAYIFSSINNTIADAIRGVRRTIAYYTAPPIGAIYELAYEGNKAFANFAYKQQVKLISIAEILFDKNPTVITNVKVAEVGRDYVAISWETNHYTKNNKVNYGESLSYGQDVLSQERARHHEFKITGLEPSKKYFFEVMSQNKNYVYDAYHEFTTLSTENQ